MLSKMTASLTAFSWIFSKQLNLASQKIVSNFSHRMPILNGFDASKAIRLLEKTFPPPERRSTRFNGRIPIFAVSASLLERQRSEMIGYGMDGWILKPIDFKRLRTILDVILNPDKRKEVEYHPGYNWEAGGWFEQDHATASAS